MFIVIKSSGTRKLKQQRDTTRHVLEWLQLKRLTISCTGKDVKQLEFNILWFTVVQTLGNSLTASYNLNMIQKIHPTPFQLWLQPCLEVTWSRNTQKKHKNKNKKPKYLSIHRVLPGKEYKVTFLRDGNVFYILSMLAVTNLSKLIEIYIKMGMFYYI